MSSAMSASTSKASSKSSKAKSLLVTLHLSPDALSSFPTDVPASNPSQPKSSSSSASPNASQSNAVADPSPSGNVSDSNSTPIPNGGSNNNLLAPPSNGVKRKGIPGPKPGMKRNASQMTMDGVPKPRGKPGPKKKIRPGEIVNGTSAPLAAGPKLGPKANQGAINAHLRALDRTGKPCRKWQRTGFQLRSFTGVSWGVSSWATAKRPPSEFAGDVKSDSSASNDLHGPQGSSAPPSDKSNSGVDAGTPMHAVEAASSPAPAASAAAA